MKNIYMFIILMFLVACGSSEVSEKKTITYVKYEVTSNFEDCTIGSYHYRGVANESAIFNLFPKDTPFSIEVETDSEEFKPLARIQNCLDQNSIGKTGFATLSLYRKYSKDSEYELIKSMDSSGENRFQAIVYKWD